MHTLKQTKKQTNMFNDVGLSDLNSIIVQGIVDFVVYAAVQVHLSYFVCFCVAVFWRIMQCSFLRGSGFVAREEENVCAFLSFSVCVCVCVCVCGRGRERERERGHKQVVRVSCFTFIQ